MPLFDKSLYQFDEFQPSWWEASANKPNASWQPLATLETCEVAIIGGGYTGLSAAYHLAHEFGVDVHVVEAGHIGWGASGRNGGFCCMGGTKIADKKMIRKFGVEEARRYYQCQAEAVELVRQLGREEEIDFEETGDCEMVVAEKPAHFAELEKEAELQRDVLGLDVRMISKEEFREIGYDAPHQNGALALYPGFGLHPLKYCMGLGEAATRRGAKLHPNSEVVNWYSRDDGKHVLETISGGTLVADNIIVACNGFMPDHLHKGIAGRALPVQSQIVVTRPLSDEEVAAHNWVTKNPAINSRNVYFYYRLLSGNRFMLGGRGDFTGTPVGAEETALQFKRDIAKLWPEWRNIEIEYTWRGFVCFTSKLRPAIGRLEEDPTVYFGFGYHGNGVNNATWTGREIARWLAGGNDRTSPVPSHLPPIVHGITPKFPFAGLRRQYVRAGVSWHRFKDKLDFG